ncbi:hypothetical protein GBSOP10_101523, partial [Armatimonadetes bacterium GBS]
MCSISISLQGTLNRTANAAGKKSLAPPAGLEPTTNGLEGRC